MLALARALVRRRWIVIVLWTILGGYAVMQAGGTPKLLNARGGSFKVTESDAASTLTKTRFAAPLGESFILTFQSPTPVDSGHAAVVLDTLIASLRRTPGIREVVSWKDAPDRPFLSSDHHTTAMVIAVRSIANDTAAMMVPVIRDTVEQSLRTFGDHDRYHALLTGRSALDVDMRDLSTRETHHGELLLLPLTMVILVLAFGALVSAALPLIVGSLTISLSLTAIGLLTRVTPMSIFVLSLTTMIGLGVGIDYSLLIVTRFREEMSRGFTRRDAAVNTILTAGGAVITSGLTVVVGFGALILTPLVETRSVGLGGLIVVATAVLLSVTLLPAVLAVLGRNIDRPRWLARKLAWYHSPQLWEKWARSLHRHPWRALTVGGLVIGILSLPLAGIRLGMPARHWWPTETESGAGVEVLQGIGAMGYVIPVRVTVQVPEGHTVTEAGYLRGLKHLSDSIRADPRVGDVVSIVDLTKGSSILKYSLLYSNLDSARAQYRVLNTYLSADARLALIDVFPSDSTSLTGGMELVRHVRYLTRHPPAQLAGAKMLVGGFSATNVDLQEDLLARFPLIAGLIFGATAIMLAIAFRSVLIPIKAIMLNTLSVTGTFGLIVLVFQKGFGISLFGLEGGTGAIFIVVPILVFATVFGLSMDYEVFLLSRIKEAFDRTGRNDDATMEGVSATASVITSAALIMLLVFGVFAFAKVLAMQLLGFGMAVAVLLDATVIRMVLVPAVMQLMGRWNWWPGVDPREPTRPRPMQSGEHHIP
jgi:RND superfamily putative drug exporter